MKETVKVTQDVLTEVEVNKSSTYPTQIVDLPSRGLIYDQTSPMASGKIEIKYMTTKEEDILTTESYIRSGVVIDKLLQSIIVDPRVVRLYDQLISGDKNALLIAARIYAYENMYEFDVTTPSGNIQKVTVNLEELEHKDIDETLFINQNSFFYKLPISGDTVNFKLLTIGDERIINETLKKAKSKLGRDTQLSERLKTMILSINGNDDKNFIRLYVENMIAKDSRALRTYVASIQPNVNLEIEVIDEGSGEPFRSNVTFGPSFFWPEL